MIPTATSPLTSSTNGIDITLNGEHGLYTENKKVNLAVSDSRGLSFEKPENAAHHFLGIKVDPSAPLSTSASGLALNIAAGKGL